ILGTGLAAAMRGATGGGIWTNLDYRTFIYPGIIGATVMFPAFLSGMSFILDRQFGFLKEVVVAPIDRWSVVVGKTLGGATQATVQGAVLLLLAPVVGVGFHPLAVLELLAVVFCLTFALSAAAVAMAVWMRSMTGFQLLINMLVQPAFFLSGAL